MSRRRPHSSGWQRRLSVFFYVWHRRLGLCAALFVALLAVTGVLLNHTDAYQLDSRYIRSGWLLDFYDRRPPAQPLSFRAGRHWVSHVGARLFFGDKLLAERAETLLGAVALDEAIAVAVEDRLLLLSHDGELLERLGDAEGVPAGMRAIGSTAEGRLVIKAAHGDYDVDIDTLRWRRTAQVAVSWSKAELTDDELRARLIAAYRGSGLSLERVMLDLHSGRIFGPYGIYVVDGAAVVFLALACTGSWLWWRQQRKR